MLDLRPDLRIALDGGVSREQVTSQPRILAAFGWRFVVVLEKIAQKFGLRRIGGRNSRAAMRQSARLIKVDRVGHVCRNHSIITAGFGDAINLDGKQNWDFFLLQLARQRDDGSTAPAVSEQDNVCTSLLLVGNVPALAGIQPLKNGLMRRLAVQVLKHSDTKTFWMRSLELPC